MCENYMYQWLLEAFVVPKYMNYSKNTFSVIVIRTGNGDPSSNLGLG